MLKTLKSLKKFHLQNNLWKMELNYEDNIMNKFNEKYKNVGDLLNIQ